MITKRWSFLIQKTSLPIQPSHIQPLTHLVLVVATTHSSNASQTGCAVIVEEGVYFIRGQFVRNTKQTVVLSDNDQTVSAGIGFQIVEEIVTPEGDAESNRQCSRDNKLCSKKCHRLKTTLTLVSKDEDSTEDTDFVEIMRVRNGRQTTPARETQNFLF